MTNQIEMVSLEDLVPRNHLYRRFTQLWSFAMVEQKLLHLLNDNNYKGFGLLRLFKCLLLQFIEDLSDRDLEQYLRENVSSKWFCGFGLAEVTPDFSVFTKVRKKIGTSLLSEIFSDLRSQLRTQGVMNETFSFIDATHLISKATLWDERDKAIQSLCLT